MESISLDKKDKSTPELRSLPCPPSPPSEIQYTLIITDKNCKYPQVYSGSCCSSRIKKFIKKDERKNCNCNIL